VYQASTTPSTAPSSPSSCPCLRHYGLAFFAFQPLAGGFLTDRYHRDTLDFEPGSRFDPDQWQGRLMTKYWH
jgi:aflatoxin B1 aldehyde reductase